MARRYEYGEHTGDVLVIAYGDTLEEAFEAAAIAVMDVTYYVNRVEPKEQRIVEVDGDDLEQLLFNWIAEALYLFDGERFALGEKLKVTISGEGPYRLRAELWGEEYSIEKHGFRGLIVKAMTYNMMEIRRVDGGWRVQFAVDI